MFSLTKNTTIVKQPASLKYLSTLADKEIVDKVGVYNYCKCVDICGLTKHIYQMCYYTNENMAQYVTPFACNYFYFVLVDKHNHFGDLACTYKEHLFDVLRENEFDNLYFKFLVKYVLYEINSYNYIVPCTQIPITPHFYEYLVDNGIVLNLYKCKTLHEISLLLLCGDVESNPGPTYKQQCQNKYYKKKQARSIYEVKEENRMNRELNKREMIVTDQDLIKEIKVQMQIGGLFTSGATVLSTLYLGNKTRQTMDKANNFMDTINSQIISVMDSFKDLLKKVQDKFEYTFDLMTLISDFVFAILQVSFAKPTNRIYSFGVEFIRIMMRHGLSSSLCQEYINTITSYFKGTNKVDVKMQIDDEITSSDLLSHLNEYLTPNYLCLGLFGILSIIFTSVLPKKNDIEELVERLGKLGRNAKGIRDLSTVSHESFSMMLSYLKDSLGLRDSLQIEQFISGIDNWFDEVRSFLSRNGEIKKSDKILTDSKFIIEVENLYKRGMEFSKEIADKKMTRELQLPFQTHMKYLTDIVKMVDTSGAFGTRPRTQPVVIWLYGESGVGKSGMSWPLAVDLNNLFVPNKEEAKEFSKHIYMRNVEQEFWDNYQGQNVVIYDDFGQRVDSTSNPNEEFMELIRTANIAPYPLHMAHLEDKRKTRFTSKVVLMTSNVFEHTCNSLTFPDAFRRRVDLCAKVKNKREYTKSGFSKSKGCNVSRLDPNKVRNIDGKIVSTDVYYLDLVDPESGEILEENLTYDEFLDKAVNKARSCFNFSKELNEFLEEYAESRFVQMQICDEFKDCLILKYSYDDFVKFAKDGVLYQNGDKIEDFETLYADVFEFECEYSPLDVEDLKQNIIDGFNSKLEVRKNKIVQRLENVQKKFWPLVKDYYNKALDFCKEHPFLVVSSILLTISSIFMVSGFYKYLFYVPSSKEGIQKSQYKLDNITYMAFTDKSPQCNDVQKLPIKVLIKNLPVILANGLPLLIEKYDETLHNILNSFDTKMIVYVINAHFNNRGKKIIVEASVSGDSVTLRPQNIKIEASVSGDNITLNGQKPKIEAAVSGDNVTLKPNVVKIEASSSGDCFTAKPQVVKIEGKVDTQMQMWQDQVAQNLITNRIFSNMYKICKVTPNGIQPLLHGLFIKGNCMLVPAHLLGFLNNLDTIEIHSIFGVKYTIPWSVVKQVIVENSSGQSKEAAILVFPKFIHSHSDITKHFSDSISMSSYKKANSCLPVMRYSTKLDNFLMTILGNTQCTALDNTLMLNDESKGVYVLRRGLTYTLPTTVGDCGAPLIINETKVLRKIAGIHVAGGSDGTAYAESVTASDLQRALSKVDITMQISLDLDTMVKIKPTNLEFNKPYTYEELGLELPAKGFAFGGTLPKLFEPNKTEIQKSLVYGKISNITTKPAYLYKSGVNMKFKNLLKCTTETPYISESVMEEPFMMVRSLWLRNRRPELTRILTFEEAITGNDDSEYIGPLNRSSSPGYPWVQQKQSGMKGKTTWFGNDEYVFDEQVRLACQKRIENAKFGIRTPTLWVDTLKDERRPIEKVDALKTRVFANGPMDFNICFRQYFLGFVAHLMENRITNEVSLGTNVYSQDWKKTALKVTSKGSKVIAGDFSTFDGTLNSCLMEKFVHLVNEYYDDGPENALIRQVLFKEVYNSVHFCDDIVYLMTHSQPSGNPVTTPLNCFINSIGIRICFQYLLEKNNLRKLIKLQDFDKYVSIVSFGDDNLINFSDSISHWFNMDSLTEAFASFGFIYTDDTKALDGSAPLWKNIDEVTYLKRKFRFDKDKQRWEAPLLLDTILETPNWCKSSLDIEEGTKVNCENSIMELSMHPEEVYNKWTKVIAGAFYKQTGNYLDYCSYKGYSDQRFLDYYL